MPVSRGSRYELAGSRGVDAGLDRRLALRRGGARGTRLWVDTMSGFLAQARRYWTPPPRSQFRFQLIGLHLWFLLLAVLVVLGVMPI